MIETDRRTARYVKRWQPATCLRGTAAAMREAERPCRTIIGRRRLFGGVRRPLMPDFAAHAWAESASGTPAEDRRCRTGRAG